jgi:DNA primase
MVDRATIERILDTARIEEVVGDFVSLKRRGANFVACCPFHQEKTPSFSVSPSKGIFKCFGCGKAGSVVTFIMEHEQMSYVEALKYLGHKYGIEVKDKEESQQETEERLAHESLLIVNDFAEKFYSDTLYNSQEGEAVGMSYFKERGFTEQTIKKFKLGYAPKERKLFTQRALSKGYKKEYLTKTGLSIENEHTGEIYDRFSERVIFPWHSISGKVIAFGGRRLSNNKEIAKYVNSPESEAFIKNKSLYGIFEAKASIVKEQKCYLVEGYTDVISFNQAGIENVVSSGGTSLTIGQIALIKRFSSNITLLFDGDIAGIKASIRGIDMLLQEGMEVKVALFPDNEDPDSFAKKHSSSELKEFLNSHEEDFIAFKYEILSKDTERDPLQRAKLVNDIIGSIAVIPDAIVRNVYIEETSTRLKIKEELLQQEVAKLRKKRQYDLLRQREREERLYAAREIDHNISGYHNRNTTTKESEYNTRTKENDSAGYNSKSSDISSGDPIYSLAEKTSLPSFVINTYCEEAEKEILYYLLKFGNCPIHLEREFLYGTQAIENQTVSQYILTQLQNDDLELQNLLYKNIFDEYFTLKNHEEEKIVRYFANNPDPSVSKLVLDIMVQPYTLTIENFKKSLIPEKNILGRVVPKSVLLYKAKVTAQASMNLTEELGKAQKENNFEKQKIIMEQLNTLMQVRNIFSKELNRIIF